MQQQPPAHTLQPLYRQLTSEAENIGSVQDARQPNESCSCWSASADDAGTAGETTAAVYSQ